MSIDKMLIAGSSSMLILKLLSARDIYGYQIASELARLSDETFKLKAGTLYPLLHTLEEKGFLSSYEAVSEQGRTRRYYRLTVDGKSTLDEKQSEWTRYSAAVERVLKRGV